MAKEKLTPEEILSELAEGNKEKANKIDAEVEKIISAVSGLCAHNFMHMAYTKTVPSSEQEKAMFEIINNMPEFMKALRERILESVAAEVNNSYNYLYNQIFLYQKERPAIKNEIVEQAGFLIKEAANTIAALTIGEATKAEHDSKLEYFREKGYDIQPEDVCQWEEFEYIANNEMASTKHIRFAIEQAIDKAIQSVIEKHAPEMSVGDDVLTGDSALGKKDSLLKQFREQKPLDNEEIIPNSDEEIR
jgi:hypothetical protein